MILMRNVRHQIFTDIIFKNAGLAELTDLALSYVLYVHCIPCQKGLAFTAIQKRTAYNVKGKVQILHEV